MLAHSSRMLRAAAGRIDDPRLASRLRRISNRRMRGRKVVARVLEADGPPVEAGDVPAVDQLRALASFDRRALLAACLEHERAALHELNLVLQTLPGLRRRPLKRLRDAVERDAARLHVLLDEAAGDAGSLRREADRRPEVAR